MLDSILDGVPRIMNNFFGVTKPFFCFTSDLLVDALGLLAFVSNEFPGFLLNLAGEVLDSAFDLIFVHGELPSEVNELLC